MAQLNIIISWVLAICERLFLLLFLRFSHPSLFLQKKMIICGFFICLNSVYLFRRQVKNANYRDELFALKRYLNELQNCEISFNEELSKYLSAENIFHEIYQYLSNNNILLAYEGLVNRPIIRFS